MLVNTINISGLAIEYFSNTNNIEQHRKSAYYTKHSYKFVNTKHSS